jgi:hypothetical protein
MGVSEKDLALRSINVAPKYPSSFLIWVLKVGCETQHSSAARPKCSRSASATKYLNSLSVIRILPERRTSAYQLATNAQSVKVQRFVYLPRQLQNKQRTMGFTNQ